MIHLRWKSLFVRIVDGEVANDFPYMAISMGD